MLSPLLMFNQLAALHWWYQNCYWCQHPGQCYFWTDLHLLDPDGDRTEQSYTWLDILIPKRRNSAAFLRERKEQCWGPCLVQCPALSDLRECHCQNQSSAIFFFMEGKNTSVTELPACALTKGESRWKVFITLGIWDSLQLFCKELLSFSISRFLYPFWGQAAEKIMVWHLILKEF